MPLSPQMLGIGLAVISLAVALLIVVSVLYRSANLRRQFEQGVAELQQQVGALQAERDRLAERLNEANNRLRDSAIQMQRIEQRLRLYEAGMPPIARPQESEEQPPDLPQC